MNTERPIAEDWISVSRDVEYSETLNLYYYDNKVYDELSAKHNGIIGGGAAFRKILRR